MNTGRYVVLGLAHARSPWFGHVARWATAGSLPIEFIKCVSVDELRARLATGRPFSAALLDGRLPAVDRDLLAVLADSNVAGIIVGSDGDGREWRAMGAATRLPSDLDRPQLLDVLASYGRLIEDVGDVPPDLAMEPSVFGGTWRGPLVAVLGRSGTGASTVAQAIAQRASTDARFARDVVLLDAVRRAHQAVLHDARDVVPGIQELIEAHRTGRPTVEEIRRLTFDVPARGYHLVLGLRRPRDWVSVRPQAFSAALDGLRRAHRLVIADTDPELEGEQETGSVDVEDRHAFGRRVTDHADLVVLVATPSITGVHGAIQQLDELRGLGVPGDRILLAMNRSPRQPRAKAELTRVVAVLSGAAARPDPHIGPVFIPERKGVDAMHRDLAPLPSSIVEPIGRAVLEVLARRGERTPEGSSGDEPVAVAPGSLGHWTEEGSR